MSFKTFILTGSRIGSQLRSPDPETSEYSISVTYTPQRPLPRIHRRKVSFVKGPSLSQYSEDVGWDDRRLSCVRSQPFLPTPRRRVVGDVPYSHSRPQTSIINM